VPRSTAVCVGIVEVHLPQPLLLVTWLILLRQEATLADPADAIAAMSAQ
jgi:hypothetical protein